METEVLFDYSALVAKLVGDNIHISRGSETIYILSPELVEARPTALLRVGERLAFYRVNQCTNVLADNPAEMLIAIMSQLTGGLFYVYGQCVVKTRRIQRKTCRSLSLGTNQIAFRNQTLVFSTITTRSLGNVVLDDTGDTLPLYAQLNALI